jgi:competence protein ComEC
MEVHFLNVGHGDCTFLDLPSERLTMIDINNSKSLPELDKIALARRHAIPLEVFKGAGVGPWRTSLLAKYEALLVDPTDYYKEHFPDREIFRYIQTHPDLDHMSGLHRFFYQEEIPLLNFWDVQNNKEKTEDEFPDKGRYLDWLVYQILRAGRGNNGSTHKVMHLSRADEGHYWTDDEIEILSPDAELLKLCEAIEVWNEGSFVIKVTYAGRSVILPGDAEERAWEAILDELGPDALRCDILKAAHHGRESGFHQEAVRAMSPSVVICSVGKKPDTDATDEYEALGAKVFSTRDHGTIRANFWYDGEVWIYDHRGVRISSLPSLR